MILSKPLRQQFQEQNYGGLLSIAGMDWYGGLSPSATSCAWNQRWGCQACSIPEKGLELAQFPWHMTGDL